LLPTEHHEWLLSDAVDLLPSLLLPLAGPEEIPEEAATETPAPAPANNGPMLTRDCRIVPVGREFRRPIAYDVDYVYKGTKYRSRLPEDPGNRLKIRVSITPWVGPEQGAAGNP